MQVSDFVVVIVVENWGLEMPLKLYLTEEVAAFQSDQHCSTMSLVNLSQRYTTEVFRLQTVSSHNDNLEFSIYYNSI